jgi:hypothetical protein
MSGNHPARLDQLKLYAGIWGAKLHGTCANIPHYYWFHLVSVRRRRVTPASFTQCTVKYARREILNRLLGSPDFRGGIRKLLSISVYGEIGVAAAGRRKHNLSL